MTRDVNLEFFYPVEPERVWRAITDPTVLAEWLMENDFAPIVGHEFCFRMPKKPGFDGIIRCQVLEVSRPTKLVYSWSSGWGSASTTVTWTLYPEPGGTRLKLTHAGFEGVGGFFLSLMMGSGWRKKLRGDVARIVGASTNGSGSPVRGAVS